MIKVKRAYDKPAATDGERILVDHLWPRGLNKEALKLAAWNREVSPSTGLRKWFGHDPAKWKDFQRRYYAELQEKPEAWEPLLGLAEVGDVTLVFGAKDQQHNNAVALRTFLGKRLHGEQPAKRKRPGSGTDHRQDHLEAPQGLERMRLVGRH